MKKILSLILLVSSTVFAVTRKGFTVDTNEELCSVAGAGVEFGIRSINSNVDVNTKCRPNGNTPLFIAASYGNLNIIKFLVRNGADVNLKNDKGKTALDAAEELLNSSMFKKGKADPEFYYKKWLAGVEEAVDFLKSKTN